MAAMVDERGTQARPVNDAGMTGEVECRYYGRDFTSQEMALLRALIAASPPPNRYALSKEFCRRIGWIKPDGGLKDMMARVTMLAMHRDSLITLPLPRWGRGRARPITFTQDTEPPLAPVPTTLDEVRPLSLQPVVGKTREGKRWNEFIARYHYLGYKTLVCCSARGLRADRRDKLLKLLDTRGHNCTPNNNPGAQRVRTPTLVEAGRMAGRCEGRYGIRKRPRCTVLLGGDR